MYILFDSSHTTIGDIMLYRYEIKDDRLYLHLSLKYEFSRELLSHSDSLAQRTKNFIQSNHIPFTGNKVFLVVDGITVKAVDLKGLSATTKDKKYSLDEFMVSLQLEDQSFCEIPLREFLMGLLIPYFEKGMEQEVLKALSVLYTTYAYRKMEEDHYLKIKDDFIDFRFPEANDKVLQKILEETECMFLSYQANYILPFIHECSNGKTSLHQKYPYLSSVNSMWDYLSKDYLSYQDFSYKELKQKNIMIQDTNHIQVSQIDQKKYIQLDQKIFSLEEFIQEFQIPSLDFYLLVYPTYLRIITKGKGHFLGMSLYGASEMAKMGISYQQILKYYFPKVKLFQYTKKPS